MNTPLHQNEHHRFALLTQAIRPGGRLIHAWPLEGGVSAQVTAIEIAHHENGQIERMVVRRHGVRDREHKPKIATDEFTLLAILSDAGMLAPKPIFVDQAGEFLDTPCLVVQYIEGSTGTAPGGEQNTVEQMAAYLARLHSIDRIEYDVSFLPDLITRHERLLVDPPAINTPSSTAARVRAALVAAWPPTGTHAPVLLHGDFWPGNILWHEGKLAAVIDWEDAATGDPLFDLASARLELFWAFGAEAMHRFTEHYVSMTATSLELTDLPFWDLSAALDPAMHLSSWGYDPETEAAMRAKLDLFVDRALANRVVG